MKRDTSNQRVDLYFVTTNRKGIGALAVVVETDDGISPRAFLPDQLESLREAVARAEGPPPCPFLVTEEVAVDDRWVQFVVSRGGCVYIFQQERCDPPAREEQLKALREGGVLRVSTRSPGWMRSCAENDALLEMTAAIGRLLREARELEPWGSRDR